MKLYISAERQNVYFINTIKRYCDESKGKHSWIYLSDMPATPGETLSRRILRYVAAADLIFMDATPQKLQKRINEVTEDVWVTNQGIVIEFAVARTLGKIEDMKVYCLESPNHLHQVLRERIVDPYPLGDENAFIKYIDEIVTQREHDSPALLRQSRTRASFSSLYPDI